MELAKGGTPAGLIATTTFEPLAAAELRARGIGGLPLLVIDHPLGGEKPDVVLRRAQQAVRELVALIGVKP